MVRWFSCAVAVVLFCIGSDLRAEDTFRPIRLLGLTASGSLVLAQAETPTPPGETPVERAAPSDEPTPPADEPSNMTSDEPTPPGAIGGDEPTAPGAGVEAGEPGAKPEETGMEPKEEVKVKAKKSVLYGAGFQFSGIFVPSWFLNAFLEHSTPLNSVSFGGQFIRRKGNFDLIASVNFGLYSPRDGNYMGKNKSYDIDVDYLQFRNLNVLSFEVAFVWHHEFTEWVSLVYGAGLGLGVVLGDIYRISAGGGTDGRGKCNPENAENPDECYPLGMDVSRREEWLNQHTCNDPDSVDSPCLYPESDVWPVIPIVHLLVGLNFKVSEQFSVRVDGGFHDAFYVGATSHYFF